MGWGRYIRSTSSAAEDVGKGVSPLLASSNVRVDMYGDHVGTVHLASTAPGGRLQLNLGSDNNVKIKTNAIVPLLKGKEEDKSSWFISDKKKFRVRTEERSTTVQNTHPRNEGLVIVCENVPRSTEEDDIKVELVQPASSELKTISGVSDNDNNECIAFVLTEEVSRRSNGVAKYFSASLNNVYWCVWLLGGQTVSLPLKYKVIWPEEKPAPVISYLGLPSTGNLILSICRLTDFR